MFLCWAETICSAHSHERQAINGIQFQHLRDGAFGAKYDDFGHDKHRDAPGATAFARLKARYGANAAMSSQAKANGIFPRHAVMSAHATKTQVSDPKTTTANDEHTEQEAPATWHSMKRRFPAGAITAITVISLAIIAMGFACMC